MPTKEGGGARWGAHVVGEERGTTLVPVGMGVRIGGGGVETDVTAGGAGPDCCMSTFWGLGRGPVPHTGMCTHHTPPARSQPLPTARTGNEPLDLSKHNAPWGGGSGDRRRHTSQDDTYSDHTMTLTLRHPINYLKWIVFAAPSSEFKTRPDTPALRDKGNQG